MHKVGNSDVLFDKIRQIQVLLLDVDGVLTDGSIIYGDNGLEIKPFHVRDGLGIKLLIRAGIKVGIVTGRCSDALHQRTRELGIDYVYDGVGNKGALLEQIVSQTGVEARHMAFIGDDLPDLSLMNRIGLPIAVADAHPAVIKTAEITTTCKGGKGAVREICEMILDARGVWVNILKYYA